MTLGNRIGAWQNIVWLQKGICQLIGSLLLKTTVLWQKKGNLVLGRRIAKMAIILPTGQWYAPSAVINNNNNNPNLLKSMHCIVTII